MNIGTEITKGIGDYPLFLCPYPPGEMPGSHLRAFPFYEVFVNSLEIDKFRRYNDERFVVVPLMKIITKIMVILEVS